MDYSFRIHLYRTDLAPQNFWLADCFWVLINSSQKDRWQLFQLQQSHPLLLHYYCLKNFPQLHHWTAKSRSSPHQEYLALPFDPPQNNRRNLELQNTWREIIKHDKTFNTFDCLTSKWRVDDCKSWKLVLPRANVERCSRCLRRGQSSQSLGSSIIKWTILKTWEVGQAQQLWQPGKFISRSWTTSVAKSVLSAFLQTLPTATLFHTPWMLPR